MKRFHSLLKMLYIAALPILMSLLTSCGMMHSIDPKGRVSTLVKQAQWTERALPTSTFSLWSANKIFQKGEPLTIYLEGDGRVSTSYGMPSGDPSSPEPLALQLALQHHQGNVAYIARPCHYMVSEDKLCDPKYWTTHRYDPKVIQATQEAVKQLQQEAGTKDVRLIGHSGGGGLAVLISPQLPFITSIITLSGNLSLELMDQHHKTPPLIGSVDPLTTAKSNANITQWHYSGGKDTVVPLAVAARYVEASNSNKVKQVVVQDSDHWGWTDRKTWERG